MLIPKNVRRQIYSKLFEEGVMVAKHDYTLPRHCMLNVPNLYVIKALQSLKSRGYVRHQFSWMWHYYYLTNEGIEYLRDYLSIAEDVVPNTLKKPATTSRPYGQREERPFRPRGERGPGDKTGAPRGYQPRFGGERRGGDRDRFGSGGRGFGGGRGSGGYRDRAERPSFAGRGGAPQ